MSFLKVLGMEKSTGQIVWLSLYKIGKLSKLIESNPILCHTSKPEIILKKWLLINRVKKELYINRYNKFYQFMLDQKKAETK